MSEQQMFKVGDQVWAKPAFLDSDFVERGSGLGTIVEVVALKGDTL